MLSLEVVHRLIQQYERDSLMSFYEWPRYETLEERGQQKHPYALARCLDEIIQDTIRNTLIDVPHVLDNADIPGYVNKLTHLLVELRRTVRSANRQPPTEPIT